MGIFFGTLAKSASAIAGRIVVAAASERFLTKLTVGALKKLAKKTTNTVDDELVASLETELKQRVKQ